MTRRDDPTDPRSAPASEPLDPEGEGRQTTADADRDEPAPPRPRRGPSTDTLVVDGREHVLVRRFRLLVVRGSNLGTSRISDGDRAVIGKHESADMVLQDETVSRFHCEIAIEDGRAVVRDLGSRNGTLVGGVDVVRCWLRSGAILTLGQSQLRFDLGSDHAMIPLSDRGEFGRLVGRSPAIRAVFATLERAAAADVTILIEGETGTGKEAAAEALHQESARRDGPFVVVDCGAIPPDLLESELFGHERGAFTGALTARQGAFEAASGGTLFLDEVGELAPDLQPKLLRVLERREIKRVGTHQYTPVDVRVVAATHRNLRTEVNAHRFRSDLFYRLAVVTVRLPPLRERLDDIKLLVDHALVRLGASPEDAAPLRTPQFLEHLTHHPWPGNIRELRNYLERCIALRQPVPIVEGTDPADDQVLDPSLPIRLARESWVRSFERRYLTALLRQHGDNVSAAARGAGLDRPYFYRLLWRYGLR
jgi:transcriptional regulator with PAS, ATPase and Fis domain